MLNKKRKYNEIEEINEPFEEKDKRLFKKRKVENFREKRKIIRQQKKLDDLYYKKNKERREKTKNEVEELIIVWKFIPRIEEKNKKKKKIWKWEKGEWNEKYDNRWRAEKWKENK